MRYVIDTVGFTCRDGSIHTLHFMLQEYLNRKEKSTLGLWELMNVVSIEKVSDGFGLTGINCTLLWKTNS